MFEALAQRRCRAHFAALCRAASLLTLVGIVVLYYGAVINPIVERTPALQPAATPRGVVFIFPGAVPLGSIIISIAAFLWVLALLRMNNRAVSMTAESISDSVP